MRKLSWIFAAVAVPLTAGMVYGIGRARAGQPQAHSDTHDELAKLQHEIARMRRESQTLRQLVARTSGAHHAGDGGARALTSGGSSAEYLAQLDGVFAREARDPAWTPGPELEVRLKRILPRGSSLRSLECRRSMCRVETAHRDLERYGTFTKSFGLLAGQVPVWSGPGFFHVAHEPTRPGHELLAVAYLGRDALPAQL
jgi:hypothetical protein